MIESVGCAADRLLHLAPKEPGMGVSSYTLCLRKWKQRELSRADSKFCPECLEKYREQQPKEETR